MKCSVCKQIGHNKRSCKKNIDISISEPKKNKNGIKVILHTKVEMNMTTQEYITMISEIETIAKLIDITKTDSVCDGRIDSAIKEKPFLNKLMDLLLVKHPHWEIVISPPRASCDIMINSIRINLKLTDFNKPSIYYSITGLTTYPYSSNWNEFLDRLIEANVANNIKKIRHKQTEYHYLVKNKLTGDVLLKPIFDIHTYVSNPSNDLQINWKNEFTHFEYHTEDANYENKVKSLIKCIQKSVKEMIEYLKYFVEHPIQTSYFLKTFLFFYQAVLFCILEDVHQSVHF